MSKYSVKLASAPKGHVLPPLLLEVGAWIKKQEHGSLGWFDVFGGVEAIPKEWDEDNAERLRKAGFVFLALPDGSMLALLETGPTSPPAVVLLGSEGDRRTVASSLEELLAIWAKGETEIDELDDEDGEEGRALLGKWLKEHKIKAPKAKDFDFQAWLDGGDAKKPVKAAAPPKPLARKPTATWKKLGPKAQKVASLVGLRVDAKEVVDYVTKVLGKKLVQTTSERNDDAGVIADKAGVQMSFTHDILNVAYPPIHKTEKSFIPYVSAAWLEPKLGETILGVPWTAASAEEVAAILGKPTSMRGDVVTDKKQGTSVWTYSLDDGAQVELEITFRKRLQVMVAVAAASQLEKYDRVTTGLFMAWAAENGLLDEAQFADHAALLGQVKKRKAQGTQLFDALGRGLWDVHLRDAKGLRAFAYLWFHNMGKSWITGDLKKVFGKRVGPHDHDEPKLDDDTWAAVDKASKIFRERFAEWVK